MTMRQLSVVSTLLLATAATLLFQKACSCCLCAWGLGPKSDQTLLPAESSSFEAAWLLLPTLPQLDHDNWIMTILLQQLLVGIKLQLVVIRREWVMLLLMLLILRPTDTAASFAWV